MSLLAINLDGGQTDAALSLMPFGSLFSGSGVLTSASLAVAAQVSPDMTVKVSGSANNDKLIIITSTGATYFIKNTASVNVTILANASGVTKTDAIVVYVDLADGDPGTAGSPGAVHVIAVRRSGVSTGAPTNGEIDAATSNNPWFKLAQVAISNGASSITTGNITDSRTRCKPWLPAAADTVDADAIVDESVDNTKLKTGAGEPGGTWTTYAVTWAGQLSNPVLNNGTLVGRYTKIGRTVHGKIELTLGNTTTIGTGEYVFSIPVPQRVHSFGTVYPVGTCFAVDASAGKGYAGQVTLQTGSAGSPYTNRLTCLFPNPTTSVSGEYQVAGASLPFGAWATNDLLSISFTYEADA